MTAPETYHSVADAISAVTGKTFRPTGRRSVGGGCINSAEILQDENRRFFVKTNDASRAGMFAAEANGLQEIIDSGSVRAPAPIATGISGRQAFIVLECLDLGNGSSKTEAILGAQLAAMHRSIRDRYGWTRDNTIGSTPQLNTPETDWVTFYANHRLGYQIELAGRNGATRLASLGTQLIDVLPEFFTSYRPAASLLHGDLWGGNRASMSDGMPVVFDPAVYFGDRETDLAMTELFGGFGSGFYSAYRDGWPMDPGYTVRKHLYNLYHVLNHYNLFGGGYGSQAEQMIKQLISEVR